jgi:hypothetical protein
MCQDHLTPLIFFFSNQSFSEKHLKYNVAIHCYEGVKTQKLTKVIFIVAAAIIILSFLALAAIAAGAVLFLVVVPHATSMYHAPTATPTPTPTLVQSDWQQDILAHQSMPEHHLSGKAFSSNQHAILITTSNGENYWTYCGAAGDYDMTIRTDAKEYTFSVYEMPEMSRVYGSNWKQFSPNGNDVVNVDCANM